MAQSSELLVPLVNAPHQQAAVTRAFAMSSRADARADVTVLNVITPLDEPLSEGRVLRTTEQRREDARDRARRLVETATERDDTAAGSDSTVEISITEGRPVPTVVDRAAARDVDRIVVGGRDRSSLSTLLFGRSVAAALSAETDVPVTAVADPD